MKYGLEGFHYNKMLDVLKTVEVPVYQIPPQNVGLPDLDYSMLGVLNNITAKGIVLFSTERHALVKLSAPKAHHPNGSQVLWVTGKNKRSEFKMWTKNSWVGLVVDKEFIDELERIMVDKTKSGKMMYMYFGYADNSGPKPSHVYQQGLQTLPAPHVHVVDPFENLTPNKRINLSQTADHDEIQRLIFLSNIAGEAAIFLWNNVISDFSNNVINFQQPLHQSNGEISLYDRTFYGFSSLHDGIKQILWLQGTLNSHWNEYCHNIYLNSPFLINDQLRILMQGPVVSAAIMVPSNIDRVLGGVANDISPVWIAPFAVGSVLQMLKAVEIMRS